eukprot:jgi/Chrzof1/10238/Cz04g33210.t1
MASAGSAIQAAKAKAIYAAPQFLPAGPINSGRFNLLREVAVGVTLGISLGLVWKTWHWNEKRRIGQYYADLARKELEEESERQKAFKAKLAELEQLLA